MLLQRFASVRLSTAFILNVELTLKTHLTLLRPGCMLTCNIRSCSRTEQLLEERGTVLSACQMRRMVCPIRNTKATGRCGVGIKCKWLRIGHELFRPLVSVVYCEHCQRLFSERQSRSAHGLTQPRIVGYVCNFCGGNGRTAPMRERVSLQ